MRLAAMLFLWGTAFSGCSYQITKDTGGSNPDALSAGLGGSRLTYASIQSNVLSQRCVSCHGSSGGVRLETYEDVKRWLPRIQARAISEKSMPPGSPLSAGEVLLLKTWIDAGAPEVAAARVLESEGPPIEPRGQAIMERIIGPRCVDCHSSPNPEKGLDLENLAMVRSRAGDIFNHVTVKRDMPPGAPLTRAEQEALSTWILDGMPD